MLAKYHAPWLIHFQSKVRTLTTEQIKGLPEVSKDKYLAEWERLVWNENTQGKDQKLLSICELPEKIELLVPHWIMDRLKEVLNQYARGEWLSSITLCGTIVEFFVTDLFAAYKERIPKGEHPSDSVRKNLVKLRKFKIIDEEAYDRLYETRVLRDKHTHLKRLGQDARSIKEDNLRVLKDLLRFFSRENVLPKYERYLAYLSQHSAKST